MQLKYVAYVMLLFVLWQGMEKNKIISRSYWTISSELAYD
jgi:hypothetical protein